MISSLTKGKIFTLLMMESLYKMLLRRGDIVLLAFPFTDLSSHKTRPAIVISESNETDVVVAFISSVIPDEKNRFDFVFTESHPDFTVTGLKKTSVFKMNKILTIERSKILRRLGNVPQSVQNKLDIKLKIALGLQ